MALNLVEIKNFTGGLNLRADVFQLANNETSDLLNVEIDPRGGFFSRGGIQRLNNTAVSGTWTPQRLAFFEANASTLMLSTKTKPYYFGSSAFTELKIGATTSMSVTSEWGVSFADWGDKMYMSTGLTSPSTKWTGVGYASTLTVSGAGQWQDNYANPAGTHMPRSMFCAVHADQMFVAGTNEDGVSHPNRVRWSHVFHPESWAEDDYIDVEGGGSEILGIVSIKGHLLVFKKSAVYAIYGYSSDTYQLSVLTDALGLLNPNCFAKSDGGVYFFDFPNGMFFYDGANLKDVFEPIRPLLLLKQLNESAMDSVSVSWVNRRAWLSVPLDPSFLATKPTVSFVFDPSVSGKGAWTKFQSADGYGFVAGMDWYDSGNKAYSLVCHAHQPYVCDADNEDIPFDLFSAASYFTSYYVTKWFDGGNFANKKMWKRPTIVCRIPEASSELSMSLYKDFNSGSVDDSFILVLPATGTGLAWTATGVEPDAFSGWGQANWSQGSDGSLVLNGKNLGLARSVQLKIQGPTGVGWAVNSIMFKFVPRPVRS
jgi:hypothetical protein